MFAIHLWILVGSIFPRVEDPWPHTIGLGFPFTLAGAGGILASVIYAEAPQERRNRAVSRGGVRGFRFGAAVYVLSFFVQVFSGS